MTASEQEINREVHRARAGSRERHRLITFHSTRICRAESYVLMKSPELRDHCVIRVHDTDAQVLSPSADSPFADFRADADLRGIDITTFTL